MSVLQEIISNPNGARFLRADLHIHSFGPRGSHDVYDDQMSPSNIVDLALSEGLKVISITDHNEIGNALSAIEYAKDKPILVVPGIELSTPNGHLLLYAPNVLSLERIRGRLTISDDRKLFALILLRNV